MKVLPFKIPKTDDSSFRVQVDQMPYFYDILHQHPESQITLIVNGHGTVIQGDYIGNFQAGDVYIFGANVPHVLKSDPVYYEEGSTEECHAICVFFDSESFGRDFFELPEMRSVNDFMRKSVRGLKLHGDAKRRVSKIINEIEEQDGITKIISLLNIFNLLSQTDEHQWLSKEPHNLNVDESEGKRLNDIFQFTMKEYHRPITLDEVAEVANMTPSAFCRYFKQRTRKTYVSFLNELRVAHACKLLLNKEINVTEVCYRSGFVNLSNFNRKFKSLTNHTPSQYQKVHFQEQLL
ncbi:MAG: AraC family transcriptional regulator [Reichenbachiella sp.]|uniref:AraC family transcriptional regulator n=1 Tax=Reichenbachiella sp. TaxID=2184521 RepID=UPI0032655367